MSKKPTMKEIAKLANVSIGTVDRVLHNRGDVSKENIKRVKDIMATLEYVPNTFARNLVLNKNFNIAVILPLHQKGDYWSAYVEGAEKALKELKPFGIEINIYRYDEYRKEHFLSVSSKLLEEKNDAVLMICVFLEESSNFLNRCREQDMPCALIGTAEADARAITCIGQSTFRSGRLAAELLSFGHINSPTYLIIHITKAENPHRNIAQRIEGFHNFFKDKKDLTPRIETLSIPIEEKDLLRRIRKKIESTSQLDGIFIPNSKSYILNEASIEKGATRIVGYDLLSKNKALLESGQIDFLINSSPSEQAQLGVESLYRFLVAGEFPPKKVSLPIDIVSREKLIYY